MHYSPSTGGFYIDGLHASIPADAIEITKEKHRALLDGQAAGQRIVIDADGNPALADPPPASTDQLAEKQRKTIDAARDQAFAAGMPYTLPDGSSDVVQTRPQDQMNLIGLGVKAERLAAKGVTDPVMEFRGESNVSHALTPQQMVDLTDAAQLHVQGIYAQSWARKDTIDAALADDTLTDDERRAAIEAVTW